MWRMILFLALLAAGAFGLSWLLDHPGEISIVWLGQRIETSVFVALGALLLTIIVLILAWSILRIFVAFTTPVWTRQPRPQTPQGHGSALHGHDCSQRRR